jgi:large subunit ribosomal protein L4
MVVKVYGIDGSEQRDIELVDEVFNRSISTGSIYHAIRNELANLRVGTASTKSRSEVRGSGTKPWRQKGTGRARAGTRQSPIWVGGGVVFGPKPRDYSYKIPRKLKRLAFKSIFSQKTQEERLMVVEDFTVESGKTRELVKILKGLTPETRTTIVISGEDSMLKRAGRNVPGLSILSYNRLRAHDLFYAGRVIVFAKAAEELGRMYGQPSSKRVAARPLLKTPVSAKPVDLDKPKPAKPKPAAPKRATVKLKPAAPKAAAKAKAKPAPTAPKATAKAAAVKAKPKPAAKPAPTKATASKQTASKVTTSKSKAGTKPKAEPKPKAEATPSRKTDGRSTGRQKPATPKTTATKSKEKPKPAAPKAAAEAKAAEKAKPKTADKTKASAKTAPKSKTSPGKKSKEGA